LPPGFLLGLTVDVPSVTDFHDERRAFVIVHRVRDPVTALADAVPLLAVELLATRRPRALGQSPDPSRDALAVSLRRCLFELFDR